MKDNCKHENFMTNARIARLTESDTSTEVTGFRVDIEIHCQDCFMPFTFEGLPVGFHHAKPTVNVERTELRAPIKPIG